MSIIRAIIVEDEVHSRNFLKNMINEFIDGVKIIGEADNVTSAIDLIRKKSPDLLFLDIELSGESGFDILKSCENMKFDIIFTTAYHEYAISAFKYSAVYYLLKPIEIEDLMIAINKVKSNHDVKDMNKRFDQLVHLMYEKSINPGKLALPVREGYWVISMEDIVRAEADGSYTTIYLRNKEKVMVSKNISALEEVLTDQSFIRIHKSYIINMKYLTKYSKTEGNSYVELCDGSLIDVSIRKKKELMERLSRIKY